MLNAMDRLEDGQLAIRLEHRNLKSAVNRLIGGVFISSLLLSSTLLISRNVPPLHGAYRFREPSATSWRSSLECISFGCIGIRQTKMKSRLGVDGMLVNENRSKRE